MNVLALENHKSTVGYGTLDDVINTLRDKLATGNYVCGDSFTTADLYFANALNFYLEFKMIPEVPEFKAYTQHHTNREAFAKAKVLDLASMYI